MRMYFYLGSNILPADYNKIILAMRVMVTGYGYDKEKFEAIERVVQKRKWFYRERKPCLMAFDCKNSQFKVINNPVYEQKLLGQRRAFLWYSDNDGEWRSISPEDNGGFAVKGQKTYVDF